MLTLSAFIEGGRVGEGGRELCSISHGYPSLNTLKTEEHWGRQILGVRLAEGTMWGIAEAALSIFSPASLCLLTRPSSLLLDIVVAQSPSKFYHSNNNRKPMPCRIESREHVKGGKVFRLYLVINRNRSKACEVVTFANCTITGA